MSDAAVEQTAVTTDDQVQESSGFAGESLLTGKDPTDSGQQEAAQAAEGERSQDGKPEEAQGAPETYEAFVLPEGMDVNEEYLAAYQDLAREHNLSQEAAQKFVDMGAQLVQQGQQQTVETLQDSWRDTLAQWVDEIKTDKEIGGDNLQKSLSVARAAIEAFGDDNLREVLEQTGMTNNPGLVRFAYRVGKALQEDTLHTGRHPAPEKSAGEVLFPSMANMRH